jgi:hypothetical protein
MRGRSSSDMTSMWILFGSGYYSAQTRSPQRCLSPCAINVVWWDGECNRLNWSLLESLEKMAIIRNYENYLISERVLRSS